MKTKNVGFLKEIELKTSNNVKLNDSKILCYHCKRTKTNGNPCKGICVADNEY